MVKYEQLAKDIIAIVGGKENVNSVAHCMTHSLVEVFCSRMTIIMNRKFINRTSSVCVASALVVKTGHEEIPESQIGCIIASTITYPFSSKPEDMFEALSQDRKTVFFSDVQSRGYYPTYMTNYFADNVTICYLSQALTQNIKQARLQVIYLKVSRIHP